MGYPEEDDLMEDIYADMHELYADYMMFDDFEHYDDGYSDGSY